MPTSASIAPSRGPCSLLRRRVERESRSVRRHAQLERVTRCAGAGGQLCVASFSGSKPFSHPPPPQRGVTPVTGALSLGQSVSSNMMHLQAGPTGGWRSRQVEFADESRRCDRPLHGLLAVPPRPAGEVHRPAYRARDHRPRDRSPHTAGDRLRAGVEAYRLRIIVGEGARAPRRTLDAPGFVNDREVLKLKVPAQDGVRLTPRLGDALVAEPTNGVRIDRKKVAKQVYGRLPLWFMANMSRAGPRGTERGRGAADPKK